MATEIKWPAKYNSFYKTIKKQAKVITTGVVVAIDPASGSGSYPGFAVFVEGKLVRSGTVTCDSKLPVNQRLHILYDRINSLEEAPDVLVIEQIRGHMSHAYLKFAVGMAMTAVRAPVCIEMPINVWKAYVGKTHNKSDENDAIALGETLIALARR